VGSLSEKDVLRGVNECIAGKGLTVVALASSPRWRGPDTARRKALAGPWPSPTFGRGSFQLSNATLLVYQPQINAWEGTDGLRAAWASSGRDRIQETFGVIWGTARTQVDRVARMVILEGLTLTKATSPRSRITAVAYHAGTPDTARRDRRADDRARSPGSDTGRVRHGEARGGPGELLTPTDHRQRAAGDPVPIDGSPVVRPIPGTAWSGSSTPAR